jgi:5-deoxy-glucuronate isomerase
VTDPAARALPNDLAPDRLRLRPDPDGAVAIDPSGAGWRHLAFRTVPMPAGSEQSIGGPERETALVTISGGVRIEAAGEPPIELPGRASVFDGMPWACYLPAGCSARVTPLEGPARVALAQAATSGGRSAARGPIVIGPDDVTVEVRGAGNATRQINHIIAPEFPADRLLLVEVFTPSGNWSSWPPHKHDVDDMPREAVLEEVYLYQFRRSEAWGLQRLYRRRGSPIGDARDAIWAVRHGELVLVTDGYHPFVAAHGDDAYYLNALAGDRRTMACSFDPDLDWVRETWSEMAPDPRVPLVT